ncbi:MAG: hypothetical protein K1Y36_07935 [Blastocatellia bacterium]|nr:hypothetical protein [Blastocatellia bacterium]
MKTFKTNITALTLTLATILSLLLLPSTAAAQDRRSFWNRHRTAITVVGGTLAGAGIGGVAGGRKGALIGAAVGAGSSAIFETVRHKRNDDRNRYYNQRAYTNNRSNCQQPRRY